MSRLLETQSSYGVGRDREGGTAIDTSGNGSDTLREVSVATATPVSNATRSEPKDSLFERFAWLYVFFREKLFRDDTERFIRALWPNSRPASGTRLVEIGCGPGFYSCAFAARFPAMSVLGIDRSAEQLSCARRKAANLELENCAFETDNVLDLSFRDGSFDAIIAARLFTVLPHRSRAIEEMHRVLRPGGRCLVAEPRYVIWASLPLLAMWLIAGMTGRRHGYCEPRKATVLKAETFRALFATQPWKRIETWQDGRYQYALCEKH